MPEHLDALPFQVDHVVARQHGGRSTLTNLALCCSFCNRHKGPNVAGVDPRTRRVTPLYHPRRDRWEDHFRWRGPLLTGLTPRGRATIHVLAINDPVNVAARRALIEEGVWRPKVS